MRKWLHINLKKQSVDIENIDGEAIARGGRYLIAKTLLDAGIAEVDPLSPENPLIFSAGVFAGTTFSSANRISVGCKSPLTGGIKEANGGGTFAYALGQLYISHITLYDSFDDWKVIRIQKDGTISFDDASPYLGKNNFEVAEMLHEKYGKKVSLGICGPVGEYQGLIAGIAFSDTERRPSRIAARGGVGAVMGSKKVKAIVVDLDKIPQLYDRKKSIQNIKDYSKLLLSGSLITEFYQAQGTMGLTDIINHMGGLPVKNFSVGMIADTDKGEVVTMGAEFITPRNKERGGKNTHSCMPGCIIQCSNVYTDKDGKEIVSPVEYETLALLGTNCGITEADDLAALNFIANDIGIDTIEVGATFAVLMEAKVAEFGDVKWMASALAEIRAGTEIGKLWSQGAARVGEHYHVHRVPVIKKQAISAYDPRIIEVTGISMMTTAQGADHTTGNVINLNTRQMTPDEIFEASLKAQIYSAAHDSLGLCAFGRSVNNENGPVIVKMVNDALGTDLPLTFFEDLGRETLALEKTFNRQAGFTALDDELPTFFYEEPLAPTNHVARFHSKDVAHIFG